MQSAKETAANAGVEAKAGVEKTKATTLEKGEKITTRDPLQKEMATEKKDERVLEAETRQHNAATKQAASIGGGHAAGPGYTTGGDLSTGQPPSAATTGEGVTRVGLGSEYPTGTTGAGGLGSRGPTAGTGGRTGY